MLHKNLLEMTSHEAKLAFDETDTALISTGSTEQHGPACALGLDTFCSWELTHRVAQLVDCVYAPPLPVGFARQWLDFPGTLSLRKSTFLAMVEDVCVSLLWHGAKRIVIINGHGGNSAILSEVELRLKYETGLFVTHVDWWKLGLTLKDEIGLENPPEECPGGHASELETSALWAVNSDYVRPDQLLREDALRPIYAESSQLLSARAAGAISVTYPPFGSYQPGIVLSGSQHTHSGIVGNSERSSPEKGERAFNVLSKKIADFIREVQKIKLGDVTRPPSFY
jgi:creatinine amidohydrolase